MVCYPLCFRSSTVTAGFLCVRGPSQVTTSKDECFKESIRVNVVHLGAERWEASWGMKGDLKWYTLCETVDHESLSDCLPIW